MRMHCKDELVLVSIFHSFDCFLWANDTGKLENFIPKLPDFTKCDPFPRRNKERQDEGDKEKTSSERSGFPDSWDEKKQQRLE